MPSSNTDLRHLDPDGGQLQVSHTTTESPILPAANLQQLKLIDPKLVQWVVDQTQIEAEHRRREQSRVNNFIFIERVGSVLLGAGLSIFGLALSTYLALQNHDVSAAVIGGATLVGLVTVIVQRGQQTRMQSPPQVRPKNKPRRK